MTVTAFGPYYSTWSEGGGGGGTVSNPERLSAIDGSLALFSGGEEFWADAGSAPIAYGSPVGAPIVGVAAGFRARASVPVTAVILINGTFGYSRSTTINSAALTDYTLGGPADVWGTPAGYLSALTGLTLDVQMFGVADVDAIWVTFYADVVASAETNPRKTFGPASRAYAAKPDARPFKSSPFSRFFTFKGQKQNGDSR